MRLQPLAMVQSFSYEQFSGRASKFQLRTIRALGSARLGTAQQRDNATARKRATARAIVQCCMVQILGALHARIVAQKVGAAR
jgi:hypothetical protein